MKWNNADQQAATLLIFDRIDADGFDVLNFSAYLRSTTSSRFRTRTFRTTSRFGGRLPAH
jgi:hypothetical protein